MTQTGQYPSARAAIVAGLLAGVPENKIVRSLQVSKEYVSAVRRESGLPKPPPPFSDQIRKGQIKMGATYLSNVVTRLPDDALDALGASIPPGATLADHLVDLLTEAGRKMKGVRG